MSAPTHRRTRAVQSQRLRNAARGFTMVELMVAMALGLLLLGVLVAMVVSTIGNRNELDKSSRQIENGRYAVQVLTSDIESAGFIGTSGQQMWDRRAPQACPTTLAELGYDPTAKQLPLAVQLLTTDLPHQCQGRHRHAARDARFLADNHAVGRRRHRGLLASLYLW